MGRLAVRVCVPLAVVAAVLVVVGPLLRYQAAVRRRSDPGASSLLPTLFDVNTEANIPTWFASSLWLLAAIVAATVAVASSGLPRRRRRGWLGFAAVLALLSLDEAASLHERLLGSAGSALLGADARGALHFAWVVPGALVAAVLALALAGTVWSMPVRQRLLVLLAGAIFVAGALGAESLSGAALERYGDARAYVALTSLEEAAEMAGALLLLAALLSLLELRRDGSGVRLDVRLGATAGQPLAGPAAPAGGVDRRRVRSSE